MTEDYLSQRGISKEDVERLIELRPFLIEAINTWKMEHPEDIDKTFSKLSSEAIHWICDYAEVMEKEKNAG